MGKLSRNSCAGDRRRSRLPRTQEAPPASKKLNPGVVPEMYRFFIKILAIRCFFPLKRPGALRRSRRPRLPRNSRARERRRSRLPRNQRAAARDFLATQAPESADARDFLATRGPPPLPKNCIPKGPRKVSIPYLN